MAYTVGKASQNILPGRETEEKKGYFVGKASRTIGAPTPISEQQAPKQRGAFGKVAEFLAPTVTRTTEKLMAGEAPTGRELIGSALEIGSYALPVGAAAKGVTLGARALGLAGKAAPTVAKFAAPLLQKAAPTLGKRMLQVGAEGAFAGGLGQAGTAIGEGAGVGETLQRTVGGAVVGGAIGAAIPVAGAGLSKAFRGVTKPKATRLTEAVDTLEDTYKDIERGWVQTRKASQKAERITKVKNASGTIGRTPERTLAEHGIIPEHEGTKFATKGQATKLRGEAAPLIQANKAALQESQLSTAPVPVNYLEQKALARARSPKNIAAGVADDLDRGIRKQMDFYRQNYGDSIPLNTVDDIKTARWEQTGFSLTKEDKLANDVNYLIGKSAQEAVEETAMKAGATEVAQLNREIGDILEATKFLENLDGRAVLYGKMGKHLLRIAGAISGAQGGIPGSLAGMLGGELIGRMLISASISSPTKRVILRNLAKSQPEAYLKTLNWLKQRGVDRELRLALPPARFTPLGPPRQAEPIMQILPAKKTFGQNIKTGQFKRVYTSEPQSSIKGGLPSKIQEPMNQTAKPSKIAPISTIIQQPLGKSKSIFGRPKGEGAAATPETAKPFGELPKIINKQDIKRAYQFGSTAKGIAGRDIDVALFIDEKSPLFKKFSGRGAVFNKKVGKTEYHIFKDNDEGQGIFDAMIEMKDQKYGTGKGIAKQIKPQSAFGAIAGIEPEKDEKGRIKGFGFSPEKAALGLASGFAIQKGMQKGGFKGFKDLTTKFLEYAKGKIFLSRQEIIDFARRPELKKGEADLLNRLGSEIKEAKIPAQEFADSIRRDLLKLKPVKVEEIPKEVEEAIIKEAKVYGRSFDEFASKVRGSATQYGDYNPSLRKYGIGDKSKRVSDLGIDPEMEVTIYRGIDDLSGKVKRQIADGDFVIGDFDQALSYTGSPKDVIAKKVKIKDLITQYPEEFEQSLKEYGLKETLASTELIYSNSKNPIISLSKEDLERIWKKVNKN